MEANPQIEMQSRIMQNTTAIRDSIKGLHDWEKDMKRLEKKMLIESSNNENGNLQPVRSHGKPAVDQQEPSTSNGISNSKSNKDDTIIKASAHSHANEFKNKGNECVKVNDFKKAIPFYTEAIRTYKFDPIYFSNRALCYLKLKQYIDCIEDCSIAIQLDPTCVKAFYRRMQANECLANVNDALIDCEKVLQLEPSNKDAKRNLDTLTEKLQRITKLSSQSEKDQIDEENFTIKETSTVKIPKTARSPVPWSTFDDPNDESIDFIHKAPHLRTAQTLKTIEIVDVTNLDQKVKEIAVDRSREAVSNVTLHRAVVHVDGSPNKSEEVSEEKPGQKKIVEITNNVSISKITNQSAAPLTTQQSSQPLTNQSKHPTTDYKNFKFNATRDVTVPKTTAQFHMTWASLKTDEQKYHILKETCNSNFGNLLGSQFTYTMLIEIMNILNNYFVRDKLPIGSILKGIVCSHEMNIFAVLFSSPEKLAFTQLIAYMRVNKEKDETIDFIEKKFNKALVI